jgi:hypothetical protein
MELWIKVYGFQNLIGQEPASDCKNQNCGNLTSQQLISTIFAWLSRMQEAPKATVMRVLPIAVALPPRVAR